MMNNKPSRRTPVPRVAPKPSPVPRMPEHKKKKFPLAATSQLALLVLTLLFFALYHPAPLEFHPSQIRSRVTQEDTLHCDLPAAFPAAPDLCGIFSISETMTISIQGIPPRQSAAMAWFFTAVLPPEATEILAWIPFALYGHTLVLGETIHPSVRETVNPPTPVPVTGTPQATPSAWETAPVSGQTPTPADTPTARQTGTPVPIASAAAPLPTVSPVLVTPASSVFSLYPADTRYLFQQLTGAQQQVFSRIYDGIAAFQPSIPLDTACTETDLKRVMHVVFSDCPELFQVSSRFQYRSNPLSQVTDVTPSYQMAQQTYRDTLDQTLAAIDALRQLPDFGAGAYENELAIYRRIRSICVYDDEKPFSGCAFSPFLNGYAKCDGYSRALMLALRLYAIPSFMVSGMATPPNDPEAPALHSWNYVMIDKQWYQCDITWDDAQIAATDTALADFLPFFNIPDNKMMRSRTIDPEDASWVLPACTGTAANYYTRRGNILTAGADLSSEVPALLTNAYQRNATVLPLLFTAEEDYARMKAQQSPILQQWQNGSVYLNRWHYLYEDSIWLFYLYDIRFSTQ